MSELFAIPEPGLPADPSGWWVCEDHPGQRVLWDGGVSAGVPLRCIPWAHPKAEGEPTGFWSMRGEPVPVRKRIYDYLPNLLAEGVLKKGEFSVYASPPIDSIFRTRQIAPGWQVNLDDVKDLYEYHDVPYLEGDRVSNELLNLSSWFNQGPAYLRHYVKLPMNNAVEALKYFCNLAAKRKMREVWLREPNSVYCPGTSPFFRRVKV